MPDLYLTRKLEPPPFQSVSVCVAKLATPPPSALPSSTTMKAAVYRGNGPPEVVHIEDVERPVPADGEVLMRAGAAAVNPLDWRVMRGGPRILQFLFDLGKPKIRRPGVDVAGKVEAAGRKVTRFKPGDEVFGTCRGAFAEYACAPESSLALKPENITFGQAASAPIAALTALQGLRDKGRIQPGQKVLINGASGGVGTFAVQIAKCFGAEVTGVCSTRNLDMVRSLGADRVIDYTREEFTETGERYDLFLDCVGNRSLPASRRVLNPRGICVMAGVPHRIPIGALLGRLLAAIVLSRFSRRKLVPFLATSNAQDLAVIGGLMAAGKIKPVIDRRYSLSEVPEALRYLEEGHARGKVTIMGYPDVKVVLI